MDYDATVYKTVLMLLKQLPASVGALMLKAVKDKPGKFPFEVLLAVKDFEIDDKVSWQVKAQLLGPKRATITT